MGPNSFLELLQTSSKQFENISGIGDVKAKIITEGFQEFSTDLEELEKVLNIVWNSGSETVSGILSGKSFVITGKTSKPRKELVGIIESLGGTVKSGVSKGVDYLLQADVSSVSSKTKKAEKLGVSIIDENMFSELVAKK